MPLLYSNVPPLKKEGQQLIQYSVEGAFYHADEVIIASGYASKGSILKLDSLVREHHIKQIKLVLGMYYIEGCPESIYNAARQVNELWKKDGIGEIRLVQSMKYHGKVYGFYRNGRVFWCSVGSNNLGSIAQEAANLRQYELAMESRDAIDCFEVGEHLSAVSSRPVSIPFEEAGNITIIHSENQKLNGVEGVEKVSAPEVYYYRRESTDISFEIPLKVPGMPGSSQDFMKSNINKCYAKGRLNSRTGVVTERGWWETEVIVPSSTTSDPDYPAKDVPFYVITDDGWKFKAHVCGDYKKNLESDFDLKVLGYWLKGRLVAAGLVEPVDSPSEDLLNAVPDAGEDMYKNCKGVITYQKLKRYGRTSLTLTKTEKMLEDENGKMREVWFLSFLPSNVK